MDPVSWINENPFLFSGLLYLFISSAVQALPEPNTDDPKIYQWLYRFGHALVANWNPAFKKVETKQVQEVKKEIAQAPSGSTVVVVPEAKDPEVIEIVKEAQAKDAALKE